MSRFRVYLKTFASMSEYNADYVEVTRDVVNIGAIGQQLDNTDYGIGVFRNSNFSITMRNDQGKYAGSDSLKSIFRFKRTGCQVKVTYHERDYDLIAGFFEVGDELVQVETTVFEGLLDDVASSSTIAQQTIDFKVLGFESIFDNAVVPFSSLDPADSFSDLIYKCLNQSLITDLVTVDALNIVCGTDLVPDVLDSFETQTVTDALASLLLVSRSVLYIKDRVVYVSARTASTDLLYTFYGQSSINGTENIIDIKNYRDGLNRTLNYWVWNGTNLFSSNDNSIAQYGVLQQKLQSDLISTANTTNIQTILDANRDEFAFPEIEFTVDTPVKNETLALELLDKVNVDYPNVYTPADDNPLPRYGQARYGQVIYPLGQFSLTVPASFRFKIQSKKIDVSKKIITFGLRRI